MEQVIEKEQHAIQMEQLMEQRRRQVQRMSTTRIWHQLLKIGHDKVDLERLSRHEVMNILAENLVVENLTFWWKLCEQKRIQIREMRTVQLKQYLVKVDYREEWLRSQPCVILREIVAKVKLAEEEKEEKRRQDEERRRREEKKEQEEKEEKQRREQEEKEAQRRQEEVRIQREKEKEEKEYAARVLELRSHRKKRKYAEKLKEEERKRRIEAKRNRLEQEQDEEAARESAESFLRTEVEKLQQQFAMVMEQQKKDREDSDYGNSEYKSRVA